jgi:signal peptidase I
MRTWQWVLTGIGIITVAAFLAGMSTFRSYTIPTGSMENTLRVGDHILTTPDTSVERGDIIVYHPIGRPSETYLKRVVGIPGDHIRIVDKPFLLNGVAMKEPYVQHTTAYVDNYRDNFPSSEIGPLATPAVLAMLRDHVRDNELIVPPGNYFVMGDNRDNAADSRFEGFAPFEKVIGKPWLIWRREREGFVLQKIDGYPLGR